MTQRFRLAQGGLIDRSQPIHFRFDGRQFQGFAGDTLASALLANGVRLIGRSFKYHRPRGILTAGPEEPNALVELRTGARREPNTKATTIELFEGLEAASQNRWPSLRFDVLAANGLAAPLLPAGFYYKTFMWPRAFWERVYEPAIRRAAGLGRLSGQPDPDTYEKAHAFCDLLVIGGGASGVDAALAAGRAGRRVILCEEDFVLHANARQFLGLGNVRVMQRTSVFGVYDGGVYGALERVSDHLPEPPPGQPRQRLWKIVAEEAVLAAGAIERPVVFPGNDLPGVMLAGAVRTYIRRFAVAPGRRAVVFAAGDGGAETARLLRESGVEVLAELDARRGEALVSAHGGKTLNLVVTRSADGLERRLPADLLAISGGWSPNIGLTQHHGARPVWSEAIGAFAANDLPKGLRLVGKAAGAGLAPAALIPCRSSSGGKAFVDFQNDVTDKDVALSAREGFRSVEHLKRYTTLGMATDQGRTSNHNGLAILAEQTGRTIAETGVTLARPPASPVAIAAFAGAHRGEHFRPTRRTAGHDWAAANGAVFVEAGQWLRPQMFPRTGETDWLQTVRREVETVRGACGVCDVSTLGKIAILGADAGAFLDRIYVNTISSLPVGRARYGLMLREDGLVLDDGTAARLTEHRFLVTTTTANALRVSQHLEYARQVLWPEMDVQLVPVTDQWAQFAIAGPRSRELLQRLFGPRFDLTDAGLPYMGVRETRLSQLPVRLFRLSFSGELAYELAAPAHHGEWVLKAIMAAGAPLGVAPYGAEALGVMRIEKGHIGGGELNGQTTAGDLGLGRMLSKRKDFIGKALAARPGLTDPERPALVGIRPVDARQRIRAGAHFLDMAAEPRAANDLGYLTSAAFSPSVGCWIGLGLIKGGLERAGQRVRAYDPVRNGDIAVEVCSPVFVDPEGVRLHG